MGDLRNAKNMNIEIRDGLESKGGQDMTKSIKILILNFDVIHIQLNHLAKAKQYKELPWKSYKIIHITRVPQVLKRGAGAGVRICILGECLIIANTYNI